MNCPKNHMMVFVGVGRHRATVVNFYDCGECGLRYVRLGDERLA